MTARTLSAVQKVDDAYVEDASKDVADSTQEVVVREFDPKFMFVDRPANLLVCFVLTLAVGFDCHASLDSNLSGLLPGQI